MARFCVATGFTPNEYRALTLGERGAITDEVNRLAKRR